MTTTSRTRRGGAGLAGMVALALAVVVALAGCAGVPDNSAAQVARPGGDAVDDAGIRITTDRHPKPGDDPRTIVEGFLDTQSTPEGNHAAARQFLTPDAAEHWRDAASTKVFDQRRAYTSASPDGNEVRLKVISLLGVLEKDGSYHPVQPGQYADGFEYRFQMAKVDGEWRIDNPPPGLLLRENLFNLGYSQYSVYFLDPTGKRLVADLRHYPSVLEAASVSSVASLMMNALLEGPSSSLDGAVTTPLSEGVTVTGNVVQDKEDKILRAQVSGLAAKGEPERRAAAAEIVWTLGQLPVSGVEIVENGQPLKFLGVPTAAQSNDWQSFNPGQLGIGTTAFFLRDGALVGADSRPVPGPAGEGVYNLTSVGVSYVARDGDQPSIAAVGNTSDNGQRLYTGRLTGALSPRLNGRTLTRPTWDVTSGDVWTVRDRKWVTRVSPGGVPTTVEARGLQELGPVQTLRLSPDGTRVAVVAGHSPRLYVGRVIRNQRGVQVSLDGFMDIFPSLRVYDVSWSSGTELFLVGENNRDRTLFSVTVDGRTATSISRDGLPGPVSEVAAAPNLTPLVVSEEGIWREVSEGWAPLLQGAPTRGSSPVYPG